MITHRIFLEKPKIPVQQHGHMPFRGPNWVLGNAVRNQAELDKYIAESPIKVDTFIVANWRDGPSYQESMHNKSGLAYVLNVERDYHKLPFKFDKGHPQCFRIISLFGGTPTPWVRWESNLDFRPMTDKEYKRYIEPEYDSIQNSIEQYRNP